MVSVGVLVWLLLICSGSGSLILKSLKYLEVFECSQFYGYGMIHYRRAQVGEGGLSQWQT